MDPRLTRDLREDVNLLKFLITLMEYKQFNVDLSIKKAECFCTWQQLNFIINFLECQFRKVLYPEKYKDYIDDLFDHIDSEIREYCKRYLDISKLMSQQHELKKDYDGIIAFHKEIRQMLHFAIVEKELKEDHDCGQFRALKYAYIQRIGQNIKLYQKSLKDFLGKITNHKISTMV